jgi:hypothetical protein
MLLKSFRLILLVLIISAAAGAANAQLDSSNQNPGKQKEELPKGIQESLAKQRIEREKKDFADLLERGEEALKISNELEESFVKNNNNF